jgi:hypothetical protein
VTRRAEQDGVEIRVGIATSFHCPFEGTISSSALLAVSKPFGSAVGGESELRIPTAWRSRTRLWKR